MDSCAARIICSRLVPRVRPIRQPRAYMSQCGAPRPVNAREHGIRRRYPAPSWRSIPHRGFRRKRISSRSHWITAPPINTLPSRAYWVFPQYGCRLWLAGRFCFRKPVPCIHQQKAACPVSVFASHASKQVWPNSAACWSPAMPAIGTSPPGRETWRCKFRWRSTRAAAWRAGCRVRGAGCRPSPAYGYSKIMVRAALVMSVICAFPPVSFHTSRGIHRAEQNLARARLFPARLRHGPESAMIFVPENKRPARVRSYCVCDRSAPAARGCPQYRRYAGLLPTIAL